MNTDQCQVRLGQNMHVNVTLFSNSIVKDGTNGSSGSAASGKGDKLMIGLDG